MITAIYDAPLDATTATARPISDTATTTPTTTTRPNPHNATTGTWGRFCALDRGADEQWLQWANSRRGSQKVRLWTAQWARSQPSFAVWDVEDLASPKGGDRTDWMQAQLVALAQRGDGDAVITLSIQLRPGLLALVAKTSLFQPFGTRFGMSFGSAPTECGDLRDSVLSTFQLVMFNHDLQRRPTKIAANLILDTKQRLWRDLKRANQIDVVSSDDENRRNSQPLRLHDPTSLTDELAVLNAAIRLLPGSEASRRLTSELAFRSWVMDESNASIARELSLSADVVNARLHRLRSLFRQQSQAATFETMAR